MSQSIPLGVFAFNSGLSYPLIPKSWPLWNEPPGPRILNLSGWPYLSQIDWQCKDETAGRLRSHLIWGWLTPFPEAAGMTLPNRTRSRLIWLSKPAFGSKVGVWVGCGGARESWWWTDAYFPNKIISQKRRPLRGSMVSGTSAAAEAPGSCSRSGL